MIERPTWLALPGPPSPQTGGHQPPGLRRRARGDRGVLGLEEGLFDRVAVRERAMS